MVWPKTLSVVDAPVIQAMSVKLAAQKRAYEDWTRGQVDWPITYCVRDPEEGTTWEVDVAIATHPAFVVYDARIIEMLAATHVLWGDRVLCQDLRLRGIPRGWGDNQRVVSLRDVADGGGTPLDRCETCWTRAPALIDELQKLGT